MNLIIKQMKNLSKGQKVKNQYGKILTVKYVVDNCVSVLEEYNSMYHITKLFAL